MFYDYFDELPQVIDDPNIETYYALTSLRNEIDVLDSNFDNFSEGVNGQNANFIKNEINSYFCSVCGKLIFATKCLIQKSKQRKCDFLDRTLEKKDLELISRALVTGSQRLPMRR